MPSGTACLSAARAISRSHALSLAPALQPLDIKAIASAMARSVLLILAVPIWAMKVAVVPGVRATARRPGIGLRAAGLRLLRLRAVWRSVLRSNRSRPVCRVDRPHRHRLDVVAGRAQDARQGLPVGIDEPRRFAAG